MIKRTIEISTEAVHVHIRRRQLILRRKDASNDVLASIPAEDVGVLIVDHRQTTFTQSAMAHLAEHRAAVIFCGQDHLPISITLPVSHNAEVGTRIREQIDATVPRKKRIWQQIVVAKITAQARNLRVVDLGAEKKLCRLAAEVKSGDPTNVEAQAARIYWGAWIKNRSKPFRRIPTGPDHLNTFLDYGYAVLRASTARALVSAGLCPVIGIHHSNRANAFALADDLMEPLRPLIDTSARRLHSQGIRQLGPFAKRELLEALTRPVRVGTNTGPLMVALHKYVASFLKCLRGEEKKLTVPEVLDRPRRTKTLETDPCI